MTQLDERKLDPAVALASLDETAPREPHRLFALKQGDCFAVSLHFAADFRDMFEVRGSTRPKRGTVHVAKTDKASVLLGYDGLDGLPRLSVISFSQAPDRLSDNRADFLIAVTKRSSKVLYV